MERYAYCNLLVIAVTCGISFRGFRDNGFQERNLFRPEAILSWRQYHRLLSSGFLHLDGAHLLMNMVSLYFFGPRIETVFGAAQFLAIYLGSILGGSLLSLYVHRHHDYRALGASGGVAGIIFAHIFLFPGSGVGLIYLPVSIPGWLYAIVYLFGSFYRMHRGADNIGHDAHLGGALVGLFIAAALHPIFILYRPWWFGGLAIGTTALFFYLARNPLLLSWAEIDFSPRRLFKSSRRKKRATTDEIRHAEQEMDVILQKISDHGFESLSENDKKLLEKASGKYRRRASREKPKSYFPF